MSKEERESNEEQRVTEMPEVTEEHHKRAKEMMESYDDQRPTITLPGSGGTVAGTAVNEWVDDDGNAKYGNAEEGGAERGGS
jgi:hypothetical protein